MRGEVGEAGRGWRGAGGGLHVHQAVSTLVLAKSHGKLLRNLKLGSDVIVLALAEMCRGHMRPKHRRGWQASAQGAGTGGTGKGDLVTDGRVRGSGQWPETVCRHGCRERCVCYTTPTAASQQPGPPSLPHR